MLEHGGRLLVGQLSPSAPSRPLNPLLYEWGRSCPSRAAALPSHISASSLQQGEMSCAERIQL